MAALESESWTYYYLLLSVLELEVVAAELQCQVERNEVEKINLQQTIRNLSRSRQRR